MLVGKRNGSGGTEAEWEGVGVAQGAGLDEREAGWAGGSLFFSFFFKYPLLVC